MFIHWCPVSTMKATLVPAAALAATAAPIIPCGCASGLVACGFRGWSLHNPLLCCI